MTIPTSPKRRPASALGHLRVLELGGPMGQHCGKLLADMGADVVKIEPPGGDPARRTGPFARDVEDPEGSLYFLYFNTNKRSLVLDLASAADRTRLRRLAATADVVLDSFPPGFLDEQGVGYRSLSRVNPALVMTSITPFGLTGPYRSFAGSDLVAQAMGGLMYVQGDDAKPPCAAPFDLAYQLASRHAAFATLAALRGRRSTGRGRHVDVSLQEVVAHLLFTVAKYAFDGQIVRRAGRLITNAPPPSGYYCCKEGRWVSVSVIFLRHWQTLAQWIGNEVLKESLWEDRAFRYANQDLVIDAMEKFVGGFDLEEFVAAAQERGLSAVPINTLRGVVESPKNEARSWFADSVHPRLGPHRFPGAPYRLCKTPWRVHRSAPLLGQHSQEILAELPTHPVGKPETSKQKARGTNRAPLHDVRVLDFTRMWAGPLATRYLADLGAEVIKIEAEHAPDEGRTGEPLTATVGELNRGKRSATVDFKTAEGIEALKELVRLSDVVIDNYPPGVLDRQGLGYQALKRVKPDVIVVGMPGFGSDGPYAKYVAFGQEMMANSGLAHLWGYPESPIECRAKVYYTDFDAAAAAACAVMTALEHRDRTGLGQYVEVDGSEAATANTGVGLLHFLVNGAQLEPMGNRNFAAAPHGCYPCQGDDQWCVIACFTQRHWEALCDVAGNPSWATDARFASLEARRLHQDALDERIGDWTKGYTPYQVMRMLQRAGVPSGVVQSGEQLYHDHHLRARGFIAEIEHAQPWGRMEHPRSPVLLGATAPLRGMPAVGEHNRQVLADLLGLGADELATVAKSAS